MAESCRHEVPDRSGCRCAICNKSDLPRVADQLEIDV